MIVVYKAPGKPAEIRNIDGSLESLQAAVEGYIEEVPLTPGWVIICNEYGRLNDMKFNFKFRELGGMPIFGPFLIAGVGEEDLCDCPCPELWMEAINRRSDDG